MNSADKNSEKLPPEKFREVNLMATRRHRRLLKRRKKGATEHLLKPDFDKSQEMQSGHVDEKQIPYAQIPPGYYISVYINIRCKTEHTHCSVLLYRSSSRVLHGGLRTTKNIRFGHEALPRYSHLSNMKRHRSKSRNLSIFLYSSN